MRKFNVIKIYHVLYILVLLWFAFLTYYSITDIPHGKLGFGYVFWLFHIILFLFLVLVNPIHRWAIHALFVGYFIFVRIKLDIPWGDITLGAMVGISMLTLFLSRNIKIELRASYISISLALLWCFLSYYFELLEFI